MKYSIDITAPNHASSGTRQNTLVLDRIVRWHDWKPPMGYFGEPSSRVLVIYLDGAPTAYSIETAEEFTRRYNDACEAAETVLLAEEEHDWSGRRTTDGAIYCVRCGVYCVRCGAIRPVGESSSPKMQQARREIAEHFDGVKAHKLDCAYARCVDSPCSCGADWTEEERARR